MPSPEFQAAAKAAKQLKAKPTDTELLQLYAHFKQATQEPKFESAEKPGMFDLKGKAKYNAWKQVVDDKVTPAQAQKKYIDLVEELKKTHGFDPSKKPEAVGAT